MVKAHVWQSNKFFFSYDNYAVIDCKSALGTYSKIETVKTPLILALAHLIKKKKQRTIYLREIDRTF